MKRIHRVLLIDVELDKKSIGNQLQKNWIHHPIGLLYLSAYAQKKLPEIEFKIFHTATSEDSVAEVKNIINEFRPNVIGLRALSRYRTRFMLISQIIRNMLPQVFVMAGGPYPSTEYNEVLTLNAADIVSIGEGELSFVEILKAYDENGQVPQNILGTAMKLCDNSIKVNSQQPYISNLDELPFPNYNLIDLNQYKGFSNHAFQDSSECAFILSSRGCPYSCFYCHHFMGKKVRHRSSRNVVDEMYERYYNFGIKKFVFIDDVFNVPIDIGKETLKLIKRELPNDIEINFPNGLRVDQIDEEFIYLMEQCGVKSLALAVETASPRLQKFIGKNLNLTKAYHNIELISKRIVTTVFFMIGFPTETFKDAENTLRFAESLKYVTQPVLSVLRVYPDTPIYNFLLPTKNQLVYIREQETMDLQTKLSEPLHFYGDAFDDKIVPLNSDLINKIRFKWLKDVLLNKDRLKNSYEMLSDFMDEKQVEEYFRNLFDDQNLCLNDILKRIN